MSAPMPQPLTGEELARLHKIVDAVGDVPHIACALLEPAIVTVARLLVTVEVRDRGIKELSWKVRSACTALQEEENKNEALRATLRHAKEWLDGNELGCLCGPGEPGTCVLCEIDAALGRTK